METKDYELFLIAVPQHTQLQEDFYDLMNKASNCMVGAMYFENITKEEISEIMANIVKKGVEASGIQTE